MKNKINVGLLYILPWILGILLLKVFPFGLSLFLSFTRYDLISSPQFIGIENYVEMFKDEYMLDFINTEEIGERDAQDINERVVENAIVHNIRN